MIKQAGPEHYEAIVSIYNQAVLTGVQTADRHTVTVAEKSDWLALHDSKHYGIFVVCEGEDVVGYLGLSPYRHGRSAFYHMAEISYYLDQHHQGKGLGAKLIEYALQQCPTLDIKNLIAILLSCNKASIALLEKYGFERWGLMPGIAELNTGTVDHLYYGKNLIVDESN